MKAYTAKESSKMLGIHESTVYEMVRRGDLPKIAGLGRTVRISSDVIKKLKKGFTLSKKEDVRTTSNSEERALQIFSNPEFGEIRTLTLNGEVWLVAKDISKCLGYTNITKMYDHIHKEDKQIIDPQSQEYQCLLQNGVTPLETNKNVRTLTIVNESGLYAAIFGSKLETAKKFKNWVTSEVLPSIRKTGGYSVQKVEEIKKTVDYKGIIDEQIRRLHKIHETTVSIPEYCEISRTVAELCERANSL